MKIDQLTITQRTRNVLISNGISDIEQLSKVSIQQVRKWRHCGEAVIREMVRILHENNLNFSGQLSAIEAAEAKVSRLENALKQARNELRELRTSVIPIRYSASDHETDILALHESGVPSKELSLKFKVSVTRINEIIRRGKRRKLRNGTTH